MNEFDSYQRAALTKQRNTLNAFTSAATEVFAEYKYSDIRVEDITQRAHKSTPTFYNFFKRVSAWGTAVLDRRLDEALEEQSAAEARSPLPHKRLLGHLGLLEEVSASLPGITSALVDECIKTGLPHSQLVPRYFGELTQDIADGQEQEIFRDDVTAGMMASFTLDSLAMAYAVHLDSPAAREFTTSSTLDGLRPQDSDSISNSELEVKQPLRDSQEQKWAISRQLAALARDQEA